MLALALALAACGSSGAVAPGSTPHAAEPSPTPWLTQSEGLAIVNRYVGALDQAMKTFNSHAVSSLATGDEQDEDTAEIAEYSAHPDRTASNLQGLRPDSAIYVTAPDQNPVQLIAVGQPDPPDSGGATWALVWMVRPQGGDWLVAMVAYATGPAAPVLKRDPAGYIRPLNDRSAVALTGERPQDVLSAWITYLVTGTNHGVQPRSFAPGVVTTHAVDSFAILDAQDKARGLEHQLTFSPESWPAVGLPLSSGGMMVLGAIAFADQLTSSDPSTGVHVGADTTGIAGYRPAQDVGSFTFHTVDMAVIIDQGGQPVDVVAHRLQWISNESTPSPS